MDEERRSPKRSQNAQRPQSGERRPLSEAERRRRRILKKKRARQRRIRQLISIGIISLIILGLLLLGVLKLTSKKSSDKKDTQQAVNTESVSGGMTESVSGETPSDSTEQTPGEGEGTPAAPQDDKSRAIADADYLVLTYDYDRAIEKLQTIEGFETDEEVQGKLAEIENIKAHLVPWNMNNITHIFYHSLVVDPQRAFNRGDSADAGFKQWMTTCDEFDRITQQMYDRGYVMISLYDMVNETRDENGNVHFTTNQLYLPEGKIPFVLSLDDLSYYHSYDGRGTATRMIVGEDGKPTCEYVDASGNTLIGPYDCVPRMDAFVAAHPDASYRGAKGTIALTGYNGILGYRTDIAYKTHENLGADQQAWLDAHPEFNWDEECAKAKEVADAIKADGWTFASHTWGHMRVGDKSFEQLQADTGKWLDYVAPLVGGTDIIIFAHGQDLGDWHDYAADNEKFNFLKSKGFNYFCNVDSSQYFLQIRDNYVRQGRRNLDGYRLWNDVHGSNNKTSDLIDAASVLDSARTDMPSL